MTVTQLPVPAAHKVAEAEKHPHDHERPYHERGFSTMVMPNGSQVAVSHRAPFLLAAAMTVAVCEAWERHREEQP